jgi:HSP20 family protein
MAMEMWDPFAQAMSLRDAMDRLLQESFIRPSGGSGQRAGQGAMLPLDVHESEDNYTIQASLPGVKPEDVQIQIMGDTVTIRGETRENREERRGEQVIMRERRMGSFARTLTLPAPIDADHVEATFENGVLTLRLPKAQQAKPRRIQVRSGDGQRTQQMDAQSAQGAQQNQQNRQGQATGASGQGRP